MDSKSESNSLPQQAEPRIRRAAMRTQPKRNAANLGGMLLFGGLFSDPSNTWALSEHSEQVTDFRIILQ